MYRKGDGADLINWNAVLYKSDICIIDKVTLLWYVDLLYYVCYIVFLKLFR
jgi:hypothetical protein